MEILKKIDYLNCEEWGFNKFIINYKIQRCSRKDRELDLLKATFNYIKKKDELDVGGLAEYL